MSLYFPLWDCEVTHTRPGDSSARYLAVSRYSYGS